MAEQLTPSVVHIEDTNHVELPTPQAKQAFVNFKNWLIETSQLGITEEAASALAIRTVNTRIIDIDTLIKHWGEPQLE